MQENNNLLIYCGLYCGDCARHTGEIARAAKTLLKMLKKYNFDQTVQYLLSEALKHYNRFYETLEFFTGLECPTICRERKDSSTTCKIRKCCRE
ncbi:MAG: DUF3795 domain-containing protein, partial [Candidatus Hodarchaeota archaeon]